MMSQVEPTATKISLSELKEELFQPLSPVLNGKNSLGDVSLLCPLKSLPGATIKLAVKNSNACPVGVVVCSSPFAPKMVARGIERALLAKQVLDAELGRVILEPLYSGEIRGLSYALFPYCQPLSDRRLWSRVQRTFLASDWLKWLRDVAQTTVTEPTPKEIETNFIVPLQYLTELDGISDRLRHAVRQAIERLVKGKWSPYHVLMHNDFWKGNILLNSHPFTIFGNKSATESFKVIDWGASAVKGYGIYDLIRLADSIRLTRQELRTQVDLHCQILGCDPIDARSYLVAALGYLSINLEQFPPSRFVQLADSCLDTIDWIEN
jgi:hypothetical protein